MATDRREFLGTLMAAGLVGKSGSQEVGSFVPTSRRPVLPSSPWDISWTEKLTGEHRAVFDNVELSMGLGVLRALIWVNDYHEVYGTPASDLNAVIVLRHSAIWMIMNDEFWKHHQLGAFLKLNDPATKAPVARNPFLGNNLYGLPAAFADNVLGRALTSMTVLACNLAFSLDVVEKVKADLKLDDAKAREMALKHVLPGVLLQPSGVFATLRAQEAGCQYLLATDA